MTDQTRTDPPSAAFSREQISEEASRLAGETVYTLHRDGTCYLEGPLTERLGLGSGMCRLNLDDWHDSQHPDDVPRCSAALAELTPERPLDIEYRIREGDGGYMWVHSRGGVVETDADGNWTRMSGIVSDVSERKSLESRLQSHEALVREALISGKGGVWTLDLKTLRGRVDGIATDIAGLDSDDGTISLEQWRGAIHPDDLPLSHVSLNKMLAGQVSEVEYRMRGVDGSWIWVRNIGRAVDFDADGKPIRVSGLLTNISENKALENRVRQVNYQLAEALGAADLATWRHDLTTHQSTVRGRIGPRLGVDPENPVIDATEWVKLVHPDDRDEIVNRTRDMAAGNADTIETVYRVQGDDGSWRWIRSIGRVVERSPEGKPLVAAGVLKDETHRMGLETALAAERDRFRKTYAATPAMMHTIDRSGTIVNVSDYWLTQMGYERDEVVGQQAAEFLIPEDRERARLKVQPEFWRTGTVEDVPYRFRAKDGQVIEVLLSAVVETDEDGEPVLAHAVLVDVTERNALNRALVEEKNRFEAIYRATPAMLHSIDANGYITQVSDYWLSVMGYQRNEVIGRKSIEFLDEESRERASTRNLPDLFKNGKNLDLEYRFVTKSGRVIDVLLNSFLERDTDGSPKASYAVITDITPLRQAYDRLKRSNRELDRFAAIASHDLQEPLRKVSAFASLMRRRYSDQLDEEGRRCVDFMNEGAERMQSLIDDLLTYSRLGDKPLRTESFELSDAVQDAMRRLEIQIEESGAIVDISASGVVEADRPVLTQMLQNLISNAIKYRGVATPHVGISLTDEGDGWSIAIRDNGIGFEPRFAEKIFAPFQRLHSREEYPGTGIGLSIVQQGIERHGGRVEVDSTPGKGSTFRLMLPKRAAGTASLSA